MAARAPSTVSFLAMAAATMTVLRAAAASPPPPSPTPYGRPTNCAATLLELGTCAPFLSSGTSLLGPPASCCDPLKAVLSTPASICLCHAIGSDMNELLSINIDPVRLALLPAVCWAIVPPQLPAMCFVGPVPPISIDQSPPKPRPPKPRAPTPTPPRPAHNAKRTESIVG